MTFDIIEIDDEAYENLSLIQKKLVRTAQKNKNELQHEMELNLLEYSHILVANNMQNSSLYEDKEKELQIEFEYQCSILSEQLLFNLEANEPTTDSDLGESDSDESCGYIVDYSLSYLERYSIVRNYYLSIEDSSERIALFSADTVAQNYLSSYYNTLYDYLNALAE